MLDRLLTILGGRRQETAGLEARDMARSAAHAAATVPPEHVVTQVLSEADGCLKQQRIVEYTGWSASKVSRTLTAMEEQGHITRIMVGREKIVWLPDTVPDSIRRARDESTA